MKILALDTSSKAASCAWMEDGSLIGEFFVNSGLTHSQTAMPMVELLLRSIGRRVQEADLFAVSSGPGSFTGLRIGISAVGGMAMVTAAPCAAVSTLWALALNLSTHPGVIVPVMDARREQVYTALFRGNGRKITRISEDRALSLDQLWDTLGPLEQPIFVGDGAHLCQSYFLERGREIPVAPTGLLHQRAGNVCLAAVELARRGELVGADALAPSYLRLPQAERERLAREAQTEVK